jgi:hypothetical protein
MTQTHTNTLGDTQTQPRSAAPVASEKRADWAGAGGGPIRANLNPRLAGATWASLSSAPDPINHFALFPSIIQPPAKKCNSRLITSAPPRPVIVQLYSSSANNNNNTDGGRGD